MATTNAVNKYIYANTRAGLRILFLSDRKYAISATLNVSLIVKTNRSDSNYMYYILPYEF